jgi:hypothetical protein
MNFLQAMMITGPIYYFGLGLFNLSRAHIEMPEDVSFWVKAQGFAAYLLFDMAYRIMLRSAISFERID